MTETNLDKTLVDDALRGNKAAIRLLVARIEPVIRHRVARILLQRRKRSADIQQEISDFVQSVFVALWDQQGAKLRQWDPARGASLSNFCGQIAERETISKLLSRKKNPWTLDLLEDETLDRLPHTEIDFEASFADAEFMRHVLERLHATFSERDTVLFQWLILEERDPTEIAKTLATTTDAIYAWKSRLIRRVREIAHELLSGASSSSRKPPLRGGS